MHNKSSLVPPYFLISNHVLCIPLLYSTSYFCRLNSICYYLPLLARPLIFAESRELSASLSATLSIVQDFVQCHAQEFAGARPADFQNYWMLFYTYSGVQ